MAMTEHGRDRDEEMERESGAGQGEATRALKNPEEPWLVRLNGLSASL